MMIKPFIVATALVVASSAFAAGVSQKTPGHRMQSATKILSTRFKIKDTLTAEEWKNLNDAMMKSRREHEPRPPAAMTGSSAPSSAY